MCVFMSLFYLGAYVHKGHASPLTQYRNITMFTKIAKTNGKYQKSWCCHLQVQPRFYGTVHTIYSTIKWSTTALRSDWFRSHPR